MDIKPRGGSFLNTGRLCSINVTCFACILSVLFVDNCTVFVQLVNTLRRLTTVFLALGWIFSNQYLAWKACFDFHHTSPTFRPMIKFYVLVGFQATAVTIATVTQSTSFWITSIISKSNQTLGNETFRI